MRGPSAVVNLTQPRAEPPPRSANGALIARTASWMGRNVAGSRASGGWGRARERGARSTLHLFPGSGTNEPKRITDTFLRTGISQRLLRMAATQG